MQDDTPRKDERLKLEISMTPGGLALAKALMGSKVFIGPLSAVRLVGVYDGDDPCFAVRSWFMDYSSISQFSPIQVILDDYVLDLRCLLGTGIWVRGVECFDDTNQVICGPLDHYEDGKFGGVCPLVPNGEFWGTEFKLDLDHLPEGVKLIDPTGDQ